MTFEEWTFKGDRNPSYRPRLDSDGGDSVVNIPTYTGKAALVRDLVCGSKGAIATQIEVYMRNTHLTYGQPLILGLGANPVATIDLGSGPSAAYNWTINTDGAYQFKTGWNITHFTSPGKFAKDTAWHKFLIQMWRMNASSENLYTRVKVDGYEWDEVRSIVKDTEWFSPAKSGFYLYQGSGTASVPVYIGNVKVMALAAPE